MSSKHTYSRSATQGRWRSILCALGVDDKALSGRNVACPCCGGKDRFRFLDTDGAGTWVCNRCGSGDGMHLVQNFLNLDFKRAAGKVQELLPQATIVPPKQPRDALPKLRELWKKSQPMADDIGDAVFRYLNARGVWREPSKDLRYHPAVPYYHDGEKIGNHPAMLALVRDKDGTPTTLHVTYLDHYGHKATVPNPKKIVSAMGEGSHIELFKNDQVDALDVAEGIETALAVYKLRLVPTYATISAQGMRDFVVPPWVKRLNIWGDNDENYTGQAAAYALAQRAALAGLEVTVRIPDTPGSDWADGGNDGDQS